MNSREQSRTLTRDAIGGRSDRRLSPRVERAAFGLPNQLVARVSAGVFFVCGSLSLVALALPPSRGGNATGVALVGLAAILIAIVCWHLPWDAWPRWSTHVLVPTGLLLIALGVTFSTVDPGALGVFYCAVFAIIGISHPPGTALRMLPLLAVMYVLPQLTRTQDVPTTAASLLIVAVICIGVAELLAWIMVKLQRSQLALQQAHDAISAVSADLTALDPRLLARTASLRLSRLLDMPDVRVYRMTENGAPACLATVRDGELCSDDPDDLEAHSLPSVAQEALRTKRPVLTPPSGESTAADDASAAGLASAGQTMAVVPLLARDKVVGLVEATETRRGRTITPEQLANAESVCRLVALSIQDAEYFTAKELQVDRLASLLVASQAVTSAATLEEALTIVARCAGNVLGVSHCIAYEYQEDRAAIVARASWEKTPSGWNRVGEALPLADHPAEASILASNQPLLESLSDPRLDPKSRAVMEEWGEKTCLTVPMRSVDGPNGLLVFFDNERERSFPAEEMALATCLAELAGEAVRGAQLLRRLQLLSETDSLTGLANHRSLHATLERELAQAVRHGSQFSVVVLDIDGFKLFNDTYGHPVGDVILRQVADLLRENTRRGDLVGRSGGDEFMIVLPGTPRSGAGALVKKLRSTLSCMPYVTADGERIPVRASFGVAAYPQDGGDVNELLVSSDANLYVSKRRGGDAVTGADEEQEDLALASEEDGFGFLESLVAAVDNKDRYTRHHSDEVTIYALALARTLGLSESSQRIVRVAGLLHDVGKIGIPDRILSKPGRLTSEEYAVIKRHPALGEKLIAAVPDLDEIRAAVASHHERYDGKGYPLGLAHQEIPLIGRILAVADAYSAMTTDRPYRRGLTYEEAVSELKAGSGTQFDPEIVAAFLQYLDGQPRPDADDRTVILGSSHTGP